MNSQIELEKSGIQYSKPQTSTQLIKGEKVEYELWFNKNKWKVLDRDNPKYKIIKEEMKKNNIHVSHVLNDIFDEIRFMIQESRLPSSLEKLYNFNSKSIRIAGGHIISTDIRMVNGNDVLYIKFGLTIDSMNWIYLNYYFSNKTGTIRIVAGTIVGLFAEHESDMIDLLNGLADSNSELHPTISSQIETKYDGAWIGKAISTSSVDIKGNRCGEASLSMYINNSQIKGTAIDSWGNTHKITGSIDINGRVNAGIAIGSINFSTFTGTGSVDSASGIWQDKYQCYGTWNAKKTLDKKEDQKEDDIEKKLRKLNELLEKGLINQDDYDKKKADLLEKL
ncbi:MAG: SHOCT domain-containing protein [Desulfobacterales bacterium]|nr:SHOCT domain-containing protein [Desulfobacterales bacterium]